MKQNKERKKTNHLFRDVPLIDIDSRTRIDVTLSTDGKEIKVEEYLDKFLHLVNQNMMKKDGQVIHTLIPFAQKLLPIISERFPILEGLEPQGRLLLFIIAYTLADYVSETSLKINRMDRKLTKEDIQDLKSALTLEANKVLKNIREHYQAKIKLMDDWFTKGKPLTIDEDEIKDYNQVEEEENAEPGTIE